MLDASERIDKEIADLGDWRGERLAEIRKLIHEVYPGVVEEWKWKGEPVWSNEGMYALATPGTQPPSLESPESPTRRALDPLPFTPRRATPQTLAWASPRRPLPAG